MALTDSTWYLNYGDGSTTGYYAIAKRPQNTAVAAGQIVRQFTAPAVGSERVFVCIVAGTTANVTDATWVLTRGAKTTDGTVTWMECSGQAALNGDLTNTKTWTEVKAATPAVLGQVLKRSSNASYQICTTAGAMSASEPAGFSNTAGVTTTDTTAVWTSLGLVSNFTGGQAPHARLNNVLAANWFASGNTIYVGDNHAETQTTTLTLNVNSALMARVICHNHSGNYPPTSSNLTTGASITSTNTGTAAFNLNMQGLWYFYGITFAASGAGGLLFINANSLAAGATHNFQSYDACQFTNQGVQLGPSGVSQMAVTNFNNCTFSFGLSAASIGLGYVILTWRNTGQILAGGSSVPTVLFKGGLQTAGFMSTVSLEGLDLSQLTGSLYQNTSQPSQNIFIVKDCKLHASMTVTPPINTGSTVQLIRCDSGATAYKSTRYTFEGTETTETSIVRTGGAVDPTGQGQSRKIVTTANTQWLKPFKAEPYAQWNPTTGANVTVTVCGTVNSASLPNNDDIWIEVEYLGSATDPLGKYVASTKADVLASNAAVSSDGSSWGGGGSGAGWSPFKLVAVLSSPQPQLAGYLHVRVRAAKISTTYYIDPKIELT